MMHNLSSGLFLDLNTSGVVLSGLSCSAHTDFLNNGQKKYRLGGKKSGDEFLGDV